jgi:hypothetical protein
MKISSALLMSGSFLCLSLPLAQAADEPLLPPLPQGYDVMTLSRGPSKITPGLEPDKNMNETATILSVVPASGGNAGTRIEWSGYVKTGVIYSRTKSK